MNERQKYVCTMALFDDGWPEDAIQAALGISAEEYSGICSMEVGREPGLVWRRYAVRDEAGNVIVRDEAGEIVKRVPYRGRD